MRSGAVGSDRVSLVLLRLVAPYTLPILEHIFNYSFIHGVFPTQWKSAVVCPVPKVKNSTSVSDYRPISILPALSKALEKIACEQLCSFLEMSNLLDPRQASYRKTHSIQTCLIGTLDDMRHAADRRRVTVCILFNFSKTFDRVQHES